MKNKSSNAGTPQEIEDLNRIYDLFIVEKGLAEDFKEFIGSDIVLSYFKEKESK